MTFFIQKNGFVDVERNPFELSEIKGIGHPDTLSDSMAALISLLYSNYCIKNYGRILHHNIDKVAIAGGRSSPKFGGGRIEIPAKVLFIGRAIREVGGNVIPLEKFAKECVNKISLNNVGLKFKPDFSIEYVKRGSTDLIKNYENNNIPKANDTSFGTAWYPLSKLENTIINVESFLQGIRKKEKFLGSDIKIMGRRLKNEVLLNVAAAFIDEEIRSMREYVNLKEELILRISQEFGVQKENILLNTADTKNEAYITVTGTSAECGDDGQVGRGNRGNGMISPGRPMTLEAIGGKNPNKHIGNFYNVWAYRIAKKICEEFNVKTDVQIVSTIGKPITECDLLVRTSEEISKQRASEICEEVINNYAKITEDIVNGKIKMYPFKLINNFVKKY